MCSKNFNKKIFGVGLFLSIGIVVIFGLSNFMIYKHAENYGKMLKKIEENRDFIEKILIEDKTSIKDKKTLITTMQFYSITKECMEYYKSEDIDEYMKLQIKMYRMTDLRQNYIRYTVMKKNNEKLIKIFKL